MLIGESGIAKDVCPFRFMSKYYDKETELYYFGYRYYDPNSCKWLSRDPLGEQGGVNLTAFCENDPINSVDPFGLAGYFFGGTGNHNFEKNIDGTKNILSNVETLFRAWDVNKNKKVFYVPGVFSGYTPEGKPYDRKWYLLGGRGMMSEGARGATLGDRVSYMVTLLEKQLEAGDKEVNVFGFSRGSTEALEFLNRISDKIGKDSRYNGIRINFVGLWDIVKYASSKYRTELPQNLNYIHNPIHCIAIDEQRSQFFDEEVLNVQRAVQVGFRGKHADVGGGYYDSEFAWLSRDLVLSLAGKANLAFSSDVIDQFPHDKYWKAIPTDNDTPYYNDHEKRTFPSDMYLHPSVRSFNQYSKSLNSVDNFIKQNRWFGDGIWK